ncbi:uncharacterized protein LOC131257847 [Magnolia sinica]|uniref:uncharacterized protein LOC131257847 n=1 Tax=Magnolia sinica TaxID=86752 RepID=UPI00265AE293|nr:uncharacterized protein LOC131257847 [Magnolia sinica]
MPPKVTCPSAIWLNASMTQGWPFKSFHVASMEVLDQPDAHASVKDLDFRADEWNVNKWAWEGALKVISRGEECIIKLEDKTTGELYARAFLRNGEPHPEEPVIDSSRFGSVCYWN